MRDISDEKLVGLSLGDDKYYGELVDRYEGRLQKYIVRFINCGIEDAQDIVQETFIKAYRNLNNFNPDLKFSSWIYRIAHNEAVNYFRQAKSHKAIAMEDFKLEVFPSGQDLERELGEKMERSMLLDALSRLDTKYKEVLVLRYMEEKDYMEISDILKKPVGTVSSLISRAKKLLIEEVKLKAESNVRYK
ncbi:MAG: RNA polymerase sigma factor [Patescibacteria group bacterium]|nr:RNA polymerase sigma factor [Patescibacteria group bacterium]MCL5224087.1 RNA polymerase sigma factor [Patescibacteria group bacterium]